MGIGWAKCVMLLLQTTRKKSTEKKPVTHEDFTSNLINLLPTTCAHRDGERVCHVVESVPDVCAIAYPLVRLFACLMFA